MKRIRRILRNLRGELKQTPLEMDRLLGFPDGSYEIWENGFRSPSCPQIARILACGHPQWTLELSLVLRREITMEADFHPPPSA